MVENISSVYFNNGKSIFYNFFVNGSRPLKFSAWFKKKIHKGRKEKKEVWKEAISCLKKIKLNQE